MLLISTIIEMNMIDGDIDDGDDNIFLYINIYLYTTTYVYIYHYISIYIYISIHINKSAYIYINISIYLYTSSYSSPGPGILISTEESFLSKRSLLADMEPIPKDF